MLLNKYPCQIIINKRECSIKRIQNGKRINKQLTIRNRWRRNNNNNNDNNNNNIAFVSYGYTTLHMAQLNQMLLDRIQNIDGDTSIMWLKDLYKFENYNHVIVLDEENIETIVDDKNINVLDLYKEFL